MIPAQSSQTLLEMVDVALASGEASKEVLVEALHWKVMAGEYWVVGGRESSGKSCLLATVSGLQPPLRGGHFLFGQDTSTLAEADLLSARLRVGLVFDNGGRLFNRRTVVENIALPLCYHRDCSVEEVAEAVGRLLEFTGLKPYAQHSCERLNRGWRQRAALARALALRPEVLLLDNPVAGLEPRQTRWWLDCLDQLAAGHELSGGKPLTLVVTTQDLRPWAARGKQFAMLHDGHWQVLGGRETLAGCSEPSVRELLMEEFTLD